MIDSFFDPSKVQIHNYGRGGRSSRSYIEEGLWAQVVDELRPGDFVIVQFGHNDHGNSDSHPDRMSLRGSDDEMQETESPVTGKKETVHTYGWYLRQYAEDAEARGATVIICSPIPRNIWEHEKIERGFYGYAEWAQDAAKASGAQFIDLNSIAADHCDAVGEETASKYFVDFQHTNEAGAKQMAQAVVDGIRQLKNCTLRDALFPIAPSESQSNVP
jgi:rhamnogalacturonan acetylesterase